MKPHPRIHPVNYPLLRNLPADHLAAKALQTHAEAREMCVGKEIDWPNLSVKGVDQIWWSDLDFREKSFSSFAYEYISFDLFLDGWAESTPEPTEAELGLIADAPKMRALLDECRRAAIEEGNHAIMPLIEKAAEYIEAIDSAIKLRWQTLPQSPPEAAI